MKPSEKRHNEGNRQPSEENDFLIDEKTDGVKPTGVDDESTGREGNDFLGKTNNENRDEDDD